LKSKNPYDCKRLAKQWVPKCSEKWEKVKFDVMEDICGTKAVQCFSFKEALIKTKDAHLLHNTETDPIWGCGRDLKGLNMMGIILMTVRDKINLFNEEFPPLIKGPVKPRNQEAPRKQEKPIKKPRSIVVGNSNVRGLSDGLQQRGIDSCGFVYPGQSVKKIAERVQFISSSDHSPDAVVCHAGDIEMRRYSTPVSEVVNDYEQLINEIQRRLPQARILVSGVPYEHDEHRFENEQLNDRIETFNMKLAHFCKLNNCIFVSNSGAKLKDSIHFTQNSLNLLAKEMASHVKSCL
jgi:lysophospholipase L1-like esterase